jgi:molybdopterin synthase sulfur carrier subunit
MNICVRLFASAREQAATDRLILENVSAATTVAALLQLIRCRHGEQLHALLAASGVRVAVNQEFVDDDRLLEEGDEVAFLPPVTGG